jgi:hypothetical protein
MRILVASIIILIIGGIIAAAYTTHRTTLSAAELQQVKETCIECHRVPVIRSANSVHSAHQNVQCATCHTVTTARIDFNSCVPCHTIPTYTSAIVMHNDHAITRCIVCHTNAAGLQPATNTHDMLRKVGIGLIAVGLTSIIVNFGVTKIRLNRREARGGK